MHLQSNSWGTGLSIAICLCHYLEPLHSEERFLGTLAAELEQQEKSITFIPCGWVFERNVVWSSDAALTDYSFSTHGSEDANIQWQLQLGKGSLLVKLCLKNNLGGGRAEPQWMRFIHIQGLTDNHGLKSGMWNTWLDMFLCHYFPWYAYFLLLTICVLDWVTVSKWQI